MEATSKSIDRWMDKEDEYNGISLSHKKEWNNVICSNMDRLRDYHTKWGKSEKDKYHMWNLKKYKLTYLQNRNRLTDIENKIMGTKGESVFWGGDKLGVCD